MNFNIGLRIFSKSELNIAQAIKTEADHSTQYIADQFSVTQKPLNTQQSYIWRKPLWKDKEGKETSSKRKLTSCPKCKKFQSQQLLLTSTRMDDNRHISKLCTMQCSNISLQQSKQHWRSLSTTNLSTDTLCTRVNSKTILNLTEKGFTSTITEQQYPNVGNISNWVRYWPHR